MEELIPELHIINCDPEEIVFTQSTTEGLNYVLNGIKWKN
jgi:selenocysteine lyase/cysteine desulfurase